MAKQNSHSYEELRSLAFDVLSKREKVSHSVTSYDELEVALGDVLARREGRSEPGHFGGHHQLSGADVELTRELFWDLFRQGVITLGMNRSNPQYPWFRLSRLGEKIVADETSYFFLDDSGYERIIRTEIPKIDATTLLYLKEAMQAFRSGCMLSATVMLGVTTEHTFLLLLEDTQANSAARDKYSSILRERSILPKINKFKAALDKERHLLSGAAKEDLETQFTAILSVIRSFRNDAGHPTGKIIEREQVFVLLHLFVPYCRKLYQLREFFQSRI